MKTFRLLLILTLGFGQMTHGFDPYSKTAGQSFASLPPAPKGGTLYTRVLSNPKALNPWLTEDMEPKFILKFLLSPLMHKDPETGEYFPEIASKLDVSKDHKVYTYTLRKGAVWEDGSPITMDDIEFTYQKLWDPKVEAAPERAIMGPFKFEKVDEQTFKFIVDEPNVNTLVNFNDDFLPIQKKQYDGVTDFNRAKGILLPVTSGAYRIKNFSRDQKLELERKKDWWGYALPPLKNLFNFDSIVVRIIPDSTLAYEKFMKGEIDVLQMNPEMFGTRVKGSDKDKFGKGPDSGKPIWAQHFSTDAPSVWTYLGWNLKHAMFASKKTRQALAMLINYDEIMSKVFFDEGIRCVTPFGSKSPNSTADQKKKAFQYDPVKALKLLKEDGWVDNGANQLMKTVEGKKVNFEFTLRYNSENTMRAKVAQMLKEQFKKAGITVNVQGMEWNSLIAEIGNRSFDAIVLGWGNGNLNADSHQLWHSKSWENKGSNYTGYSNPEVDALIEQSDKELDPKKRFKITQKIGSIIYDDQPYAFIVEIPGIIMGVNSKIQSKKWVMKYDNYFPPIWMYYAQ